jgi:hypothetical protein
MRLHKKDRIKQALLPLNLEGLQEVTVFLNDLLRKRFHEKLKPAKPHSDRDVLEIRRADGITYRLERVYCGKKCSKCPHGPYWYVYWKDVGRTRSRYVGKTLE